MMIGRPLTEQYSLPLSEEEQSDMPGMPMGEGQGSKFQTLNRLDFTVEFCWRPHSEQKPSMAAGASAAPAN